MMVMIMVMTQGTILNYIFFRVIEYRNIIGDKAIRLGEITWHHSTWEAARVLQSPSANCPRSM